MATLESSIRHLHSLGLAHNDINPSNISVNARCIPILAEFDSCCPVGEMLTYSRGTQGRIVKKTAMTRLKYGMTSLLLRRFESG